MSKILKKWIGSNQVDGQKIRLSNEEALRGRNNADTADINILKVDSSDKVEFLTEPKYDGAPTTPTSLTNKQWVLDVLAGMRDMKDAVRVATPATLPSYTAAGVGLGKTLTADSNGELVLDGVTDLVDGDRVGVLNEGVHNGIYVLTQGTAGTPWVLTRSTDADNNPDGGEVTQGMSFDVVEGLVLGKSRWLLTTKTINIDVTSLTFVEVPVPQDQVQFKTEDFTLAAIDITNGYVELAHQAETGSLVVYPKGGIVQDAGTDYLATLSGSVTRITFAGDLLELAEGDKLIAQYAHF